MKMRTIYRRLTRNLRTTLKVLNRLQGSHHAYGWAVNCEPLDPVQVEHAFRQRYPLMRLPKDWIDRVRRHRKQ